MQDEDRIDLSQLNTPSAKPKSPRKKLFNFSFFKKQKGVQRDAEGKFTSGSGGLSTNNKFDLRRTLPVVLMVALVGGFMVFQSFAATPEVGTQVANGKILAIDVNQQGQFPPPTPYMMNVDGSDKVPLTGEAAKLYNSRYGIRYSRDGKRTFAVRSDRNSQNDTTTNSLVAYDSLNGANLKVLYTTEYTGHLADTEGLEAVDKVIGELADGRIVFATNQQNPYKDRLYTVNPDGSGGTPALLFDPPNGQDVVPRGVSNGQVIVEKSSFQNESGQWIKTISSISAEGVVKDLFNTKPFHNAGAVSISGSKILTVVHSSYSQTGQATGGPEADGTGMGGGNPAEYHVNSLKTGETETVIYADELLRKAGFDGSVFGNPRAQVDFTEWSPDGRYLIFRLLNESGATSSPRAPVIVDAQTGEITKKFGQNTFIYAWQPIPADPEKRAPTPTCTLEIDESWGGSSYVHTATWTSKDVPAGWTTRLFTVETGTTVPNLPANGSQVVTFKMGAENNVYHLYFTDPANPQSTANGCSASWSAARHTDSDPPQEKREPTPEPEPEPEPPKEKRSPSIIN